MELGQVTMVDVTLAQFYFLTKKTANQKVFSDSFRQ